MIIGTDSLRVDSRLCRGPLLLSLLGALVLVGCSGAALPRLGDLMGEQDNAKVAAAPPGGQVAPTPPAGAAIATPHQPRATNDLPLAQTSRAPREGEMIVAFKGPTIVLFGGEVGEVGERVPTSTLTLPLQMKYASSNASRVQIETPHGPRWVARSEILIGGGIAAPVRR